MHAITVRFSFYLLMSLCSFLMLNSGCIRFEDADAPPKSPEAPELVEQKEESLLRLEEPPKNGYKVKFETSKGDFVVQVDNDLAPEGAKRFYNLVKSGFYNECRFFRVVPNFMVQFGISGNPPMNSKWSENIVDDPVKTSNTRGTITFATSGPDSRTTQVFINYKDNNFLDGQGFSPFGKVIEGMDVVDKIESKHGEEPNQGLITNEGNAYLQDKFPDLDFIRKASIIEETSEAEKKPETDKKADEPPPASDTPQPAASPEMKKETAPETEKPASPDAKETKSDSTKSETPTEKPKAEEKPATEPAGEKKMSETPAPESKPAEKESTPKEEKPKTE